MDVAGIFLLFGNILYVASYLVRDIFILRFLTIVAGISLMVYYFLFDKGPLWEPFWWGLGFTLINIFQVYVLFRQRRPVQLSSEENDIYNMSFAELTLKEFKKLFDVSKSDKVKAGDSIVEAHKPVHRVAVLKNGRADVEKDGSAVKSVEPGAFVGEISFVTQRPPAVSVKAAEESEILYWDCDDLQKVLQSDPQLRAAWQSMISRKIAEKVRTK